MMQPQAKERQKPSETESDKERILQEHVPLTLWFLPSPMISDF